MGRLLEGRRLFFNLSRRGANNEGRQILEVVCGPFDMHYDWIMIGFCRMWRRRLETRTLCAASIASDCSVKRKFMGPNVEFELSGFQSPLTDSDFDFAIPSLLVFFPY